ncbi:DUF7284 family protein [Natronorubrum texcoconense]|uniref:Uncharacterized protein n=1 Tax=Natronorubrum texcoconense TaxID=1095776 RepID=A0A1G9FPB0_9EURY|nr:hypothetical protein [Natronorubrum texcoconense]SDK90268.1 hypothetical protein SAMN04515672_4226 [Natronorubrum texcoconense]
MALLLVSASVLLLGAYLHAADDDRDETRPDRTVETLAAVTLSVEYDLGAADPVDERDGNYTRTDFGSATGLLADAAVTNLHIDGDQILPYADDFEDAVDASTKSALLGANHEFYVVAEWEPYNGAAINGTATAGERPPPDEDVSSRTITASSDLPAVDEADLSVGSDDDALEVAGAAIGAAIIEGYLPADSVQRTLESQGLSRELTVYHYERLVAPLEYEFGEETNADDERPLNRSDADALEANERVLYGSDGESESDSEARGLADWIANDLETAFADELEAIDEDSDDDAEREEAVAALLAEEVSTDDVTITVQTWQP